MTCIFTSVFLFVLSVSDMSNYRVTIFAQDGITVMAVYTCLYSAPTIVDAHYAGEKLIERFNAHRPIGTHFFVAVTDANAE